MRLLREKKTYWAKFPHLFVPSSGIRNATTYYTCVDKTEVLSKAPQRGDDQTTICTYCSERRVTIVKVMTTHILGIGVGLFVILILWLSVALIFVVSLRIDKRIGVIAIIVGTIITAILATIPRSSEHPTLRLEKPYDQLLLWRIILSSILAASSLIAIFGFIKYELMERNRSHRITKWIY